jgi:hypothetical protein
LREKRATNTVSSQAASGTVVCTGSGLAERPEVERGVVMAESADSTGCSSEEVMRCIARVGRGARGCRPAPCAQHPQAKSVPSAPRLRAPLVSPGSRRPSHPASLFLSGPHPTPGIFEDTSSISLTPYIGSISGHTRSLPNPISVFSPISGPIWSRYCKKYRNIRISGQRNLDIVPNVYAISQNTDIVFGRFS